MSRHVEAVKRLFEAVRRRDEAALLESYHPDVSIHEAPSLPYGGDFHGHAGAVDHERAFYRTWEGLKPRELIEVARQTTLFLEAGQDYVLVFGRQRGVAPRTERSLDIPEAFLFKMSDNRVIESWMFNQDTVAVLEFLRAAKL
jgi:ketosteroid isomerase-like protein